MKFDKDACIRQRQAQLLNLRLHVYLRSDEQIREALDTGITCLGVVVPRAHPLLLDDKGAH